jgi:hypothetical protein
MYDFLIAGNFALDAHAFMPCSRFVSLIEARARLFSLSAPDVTRLNPLLTDFRAKFIVAGLVGIIPSCDQIIADWCQGDPVLGQKAGFP